MRELIRAGGRGAPSVPCGAGCAGVLGYGAILRLPARSPLRLPAHPSGLAPPAWRPPAVSWSRSCVPVLGQSVPRPGRLRRRGRSRRSRRPCARRLRRSLRRLRRAVLHRPSGAPAVAPRRPPLCVGARSAAPIWRVGGLASCPARRPAASRRRRAPPMGAAPMPAGGQAPPPTAGYACGRAAATPAVGRWVRAPRGRPPRSIRCSRACGLAATPVLCDCMQSHLPGVISWLPSPPGAWSATCSPPV